MNQEARMRLTGKTILVTAAGQGLGPARALGCVREGAQGFATDLLESLAREAPALRTHLLDVRDDAAVQALASQLPAIDGLFNCAGFVHEGTILQCDEAAWDFSVARNVKGSYRAPRALLPAMLDKLARTGGPAAILNMASMASSVKGLPNR